MAPPVAVISAKRYAAAAVAWLFVIYDVLSVISLGVPAIEPPDPQMAKFVVASTVATAGALWASRRRQQVTRVSEVMLGACLVIMSSSAIWPIYQLSRETGVPPAELHEIAAFYAAVAALPLGVATWTFVSLAWKTPWASDNR